MRGTHAQPSGREKKVPVGPPTVNTISSRPAILNYGAGPMLVNRKRRTTASSRFADGRVRPLSMHNHIILRTRTKTRSKKDVPVTHRSRDKCFFCHECVLFLPRCIIVHSCALSCILAKIMCLPVFAFCGVLIFVHFVSLQHM